MSEAGKDLQRFRLLQAARKALVLQCLVGPVLGVLSCHPCLVPGALSTCGGVKTWLFAVLQRLQIWCLECPRKPQASAALCSLPSPAAGPVPSSGGLELGKASPRRVIPLKHLLLGAAGLDESPVPAA